MSADSIKDFLVSLGFQVDKDGLKNFNDVLNDSEKVVTKLGKSMVGMAVATVGAVAIAANSLEKLYYSSQRVGASAANIKAYEATIANMGGTAEGAANSLEELARKMRNSPGYEGMLQGIGVNTRNANGTMKDRVEVMKDLSKVLGSMPSYKANAYAGALGIDEKTMLAMRDPAFSANLDRIQKLRVQMGMTDDLAKSGQEFSAQYRELTTNIKTILEVIVMTAGKKLIPIFTWLNTGMETLVGWFSQLNPQTRHFLGNLLGWAAGALVVGGLIFSVAKLVKVFMAFKNVIAILKLVTSVFRIFTLSILMNPVVMAITAIIVALGLLWNDFQTWKNGGKSLIDWGAVLHGFDLVKEGITSLIKHFSKLGEMISAVFHGDFKGAAKIAKELMGEVVEAVAPVVKTVTEAAPKVIEHVTEAAKKGVAVVAQVGTGIKQKLKGSKYENFNRVLVAARDAGDPHPEIVAAQWALESAWGKKTSGKNNFFGIKENDPTKPRTSVMTHEYENGIRVKKAQYFADYQSIEEGVKARVEFMKKNKRYGKAGYFSADTPIGAAESLLKAKYATDPAYVRSLMGVLKSVGINKSAPSFSAPTMPTMPYRELQNRANSNDSSSTKTVSVSSTTTINVNGSDSPQATANAVSRAQQNTNAVLVRNTGNVVR